jgi:hypothetical protein
VASDGEFRSQYSIYLRQSDRRLLPLPRVAKRVDGHPSRYTVQDMYERKKWGLYFEKWGCRKCEKKTVNHASTGHCDACSTRLVHRLATIRRDYFRAHPNGETEEQINQLTSKARTAEALLRNG